jgi:hypothetical protein
MTATGPDPPPAAGERSVRRLVGVYHASGTLSGEIAYLVRARLGRAHCALCDITHGAIREKADWRACRQDVAVPFDTVHLNERDSALVAATEGRTPCVVAETAAGLEVLLDESDLEACRGSPRRLVQAVVDAARARGLTLG